MLCLFETPAGFALFKVQDEKRIERVDVRALPSLFLQRQCTSARSSSHYITEHRYV